MSNFLKILVVDDDKKIRKLLADFLSEKYKVISAKNGVKAWEKILKNDGNLDVVISDIDMPEMDGVSLLKNIHQQYPKICVIMISGTSDVQVAMEAMRHGAYDYVVKPFSSLAEIELLIQRWARLQTLDVKLEKYAALHKDIITSMKSRTFMAVDVVGSRSLKVDEDVLLTQHSFSNYHRFIKSIVLQCGGQVHSTAGDGVMNCFDKPKDAMDAATKIMAELPDFNRKHNHLSRPFALRIGIHTGNVVIEESGRISEMYSQSLDIAGHMQKSASSNQVQISESTIENFPDKSNFELTEKKEEGLPIYLLRTDLS